MSPLIKVDGRKKILKHIYKDGARYHVIAYCGTDRGPFDQCSEKQCEINKREYERYQKSNRIPEPIVIW